MDSRSDRLHIVFFPHMSHGHLIPTMDLARTFSKHVGVKATIVTTALNAALFSETIERDQKLGLDISIRTLRFPGREAGLPEGCESLNSVTSMEMGLNYYKAIRMLREPLAEILQEFRPSCLVADTMFPWATEVASRFGIPRLIFHGTSLFAMCAFFSVRLHEPHREVGSDHELFILPGLPDEIKMTRMQLPSYVRERIDNDLTRMIDESVEADGASFGVVVNSFRELEPAYSEHYMKVLGRRVWHVGPVSLCNRSIQDKEQRGNGNKSSVEGQECLEWLESKKPDSVIFLSFGSMFEFSGQQLLEIVMGLEASGQQFILAIRNKGNTDGDDVLPKGIEKSVKEKGKGLIVRGWAPQVLILEHEAVGGFVTHCGWNSTLEAITAGVPMLTWPLYAEQFYNEKLVTDVLRVGVGLGAQECERWSSERKFLVGRKEIEGAVLRFMVGEEAVEIRRRAKALGEAARRAVERGGSSYCDAEALLAELRSKLP
ncbi:scopoletin glucosyltransferase-like [Punica granatum]|uniref:Glycosyltransferase n=2 Tax=Punica granatum TaxID=22663 RepID=A0A218XG58_PUNGR|nr:scopoletin glucosyltransferase-like [Punica granatum]OWM83706.1 hypothetical protein CDL15_Pgr004136 [Punica granatum]PKI75307.1 hypothetical protein CRG98_004347 [Punica granatum]